MDIDKLAQEAGFSVKTGHICDPRESAWSFNEELERFAALVAEECAKLSDAAANRAWNESRSEAWSDEFELLAKNIRGLIKSA